MKKIHLAILIAILFSTCKKDEPKVEEKKSSTREYLINKKWYTKAITITPPFMGITNFYDELFPCYKDDTLIYQTNGIRDQNNGALKCNQNDPQIDSKTTWTINGNQLVTNLDIGTQILRDTLNIISISNKRVAMEYIQKINKISYTYLYVYENN